MIIAEPPFDLADWSATGSAATNAMANCISSPPGNSTKGLERPCAAGEDAEFLPTSALHYPSTRAISFRCSPDPARPSARGFDGRPSVVYPLSRSARRATRNAPSIRHRRRRPFLAAARAVARLGAAVDDLVRGERHGAVQAVARRPTFRCGRRRPGRRLDRGAHRSDLLARPGSVRSIRRQATAGRPRCADQPSRHPPLQSARRPTGRHRDDSIHASGPTQRAPERRAGGVLPRGGAAVQRVEPADRRARGAEPPCRGRAAAQPGDGRDDAARDAHPAPRRLAGRKR